MSMKTVNSLAPIGSIVLSLAALSNSFNNNKKLTERVDEIQKKIADFIKVFQQYDQMNKYLVEMSQKVNSNESFVNDLVQKRPKELKEIKYIKNDIEDIISELDQFDRLFNENNELRNQLIQMNQRCLSLESQLNTVNNNFKIVSENLERINAVLVNDGKPVELKKTEEIQVNQVQQQNQQNQVPLQGQQFQQQTYQQQSQVSNPYQTQTYPQNGQLNGQVPHMSQPYNQFSQVNNKQRSQKSKPKKQKKRYESDNEDSDSEVQERLDRRNRNRG